MRKKDDGFRFHPGKGFPVFQRIKIKKIVKILQYFLKSISNSN